MPDNCMEQANKIINSDESVAFPPRHYPSHPAPRVPHIPFIPRDHMDMRVKNRLPGCGMDVDAHVEAIGLVLLLQDGPDAVGHQPAGLLLFDRQLEVVCAVALGQDEGVPFGYRVLVVNGIGRGALGDGLALFGGGTENTAVPFLGKRVVLVFVDFAEVVEQGALEGQRHIALKGLLFMHAVGAEAFVAHIPPYGKVGFAAKLQQLRNMHQHFSLLLGE